MASCTACPSNCSPASDGRRLLESHVVSYVPSGSVLAVLRRRRSHPRRRSRRLAVSASPPERADRGVRAPRPSRVASTTSTLANSGRFHLPTMRRDRSAASSGEPDDGPARRRRPPRRREARAARAAIKSCISPSTEFRAPSSRRAPRCCFTRQRPTTECCRPVRS